MGIMQNKNAVCIASQVGEGKSHIIVINEEHTFVMFVAN